MSFVPSQSQDALRVIRVSEPGALAATVIPNENGPARSFPGIALNEFEFRGTLDVEGIPNNPEQAWTAVFTDRGAVFENHPEDGWPSVRIEFGSGKSFGASRIMTFFSALPELHVTSLSIRPSGNTVDAELLFTRVLLSADIAGRSSLVDSQSGLLFGLTHEPLTEDQRRDLVARAKFFRKLKYLESVFNTTFLLPSEISVDEERLAEIVFTGITRGISVIRGSDITVGGVLLSEVNIGKPPFTGTGEFRRVVSWNGKWVGMLGRTLEVGPVTLVLSKTEIADPRVLDHMARFPDQPVDLRFVVYDHRIVHQFEAFLGNRQEKQAKQLDELKRKLALEEPREIAELVSEPMAREVSIPEAIQIAHGWLYWNRFPDRYCPQDPEPGDAANVLRVPIRLVYADGSGGPVGELRIDKATGEVVEHTPLEEMQAKGLALAETIFHG